MSAEREAVVPSPYVFWRPGYEAMGRRGYFVLAAAVNTIVPNWIAAGHKVAGIRIDPENAEHVELIVYVPGAEDDD